MVRANTETVRALRAAAKARGDCQECMRRPAEPGCYHCESCKERQRKRLKAKRSERAQRGECVRCGRPELAVSATHGELARCPLCTELHRVSAERARERRLLRVVWLLAVWHRWVRVRVDDMSPDWHRA